MPFHRDNILYESFVGQEAVTKAWDAIQKTWWFPESCWPFARAVISGCRGADNLELLKLDALLAGKPVGNPAVGDEGDYGVLGLAENAPYELVKLAYTFWRNEFKYAPGIPMQLNRIEEAFKRISATA